MVLELIKRYKDKLKVGLEIHLTLPTKTKLFCSCSTEEGIENTNICPICLGYPGTRPKLNKKALEYGIKICKMLNCNLNKRILFSRKSYFYPDLPKNYQITQYELPLGIDGYIDIFFKDKHKRIRIKEVHLEEDAAKIKRGRNNVSIIDYNRAGIPLIEIVTYPDLSSLKQIEIFLQALIGMIKYSGINKINIKADVNVSMFGDRVEIKNVTGISNIKKAIIAELIREAKMYKEGKSIEKVTVKYDEEKDVTYIIRKKEEEEEYGYIFEPDLGEFDLSALIENIKIEENPNDLFIKLRNLFKNEELIRKIVYNYPNVTRFLIKTKDIKFVESIILKLINKYKLDDVSYELIIKAYHCENSYSFLENALLNKNTNN